MIGKERFIDDLLRFLFEALLAELNTLM